jgi:hypothetical protein
MEESEEEEDKIKKLQIENKELSKKFVNLNQKYNECLDQINTLLNIIKLRDKELSLIKNY